MTILACVCSSSIVPFLLFTTARSSPAIHAHPSHGDDHRGRTNHHDRRQPHRHGGGAVTPLSSRLRPRLRPPARQLASTLAPAPPGLRGNFSGGCRAFETWPRQPRDFRAWNAGALGSGVANVGNTISGLYNTSIVESGDASFNPACCTTAWAIHDPNFGLANVGGNNVGGANAGIFNGLGKPKDYNIGFGNLGGDNLGFAHAGSYNIGFANTGSNNLGSRTR